MELAAGIATQLSAVIETTNEGKLYQ